MWTFSYVPSLSAASMEALRPIESFGEGWGPVVLVSTGDFACISRCGTGGLYVD